MGVATVGQKIKDFSSTSVSLQQVILIFFYLIARLYDSYIKVLLTQARQKILEEMMKDTSIGRGECMSHL